jgi:hypothetical protein
MKNPKINLKIINLIELNTYIIYKFLLIFFL